MASITLEVFAVGVRTMLPQFSVGVQLAQFGVEAQEAQQEGQPVEVVEGGEGEAVMEWVGYRHSGSSSKPRQQRQPKQPKPRQQRQPKQRQPKQRKQQLPQQQSLLLLLVILQGLYLEETSIVGVYCLPLEQEPIEQWQEWQHGLKLRSSVSKIRLQVDTP